VVIALYISERVAIVTRAANVQNQADIKALRHRVGWLLAIQHPEEIGRDVH
jgi:hypothetical protein